MRYLTRPIAIALSLLPLACGPSSSDGPGGRADPSKPPSGPPLSTAAQPIVGGDDDAEQTRGYPLFPDHHSGVVVFSAEGDLWQGSAKGGLARRLTTHEGNELFAHFSPDGKLLAFCGDYDGNQDVFVMASTGGRPRRLTFHPAADQVLGWSADGKSVLFRSKRDHPHGDWTPWTIAVSGGDPLRLPLARASRLSFEPGGKRVAINRVDRDFRRWKRYAGGTAAQIFVGDLAGAPFRKLTTFKGSNAYPMWHGGRIYFLSDRDGTMNIWSISAAGAELRQHTRFDDYDVRYPSLNDGVIAFTQRAEVKLLDLKTDKVRPVPLQILSDAPRVRTRYTDPAKYISDFTLSPDGRHIALEIRGDLHLLPVAKEGRRLRISSGSATREQGLSFSDDGKQVATVSDASGETEIVVYDAHGGEKARAVTSGGERLKLTPRWAPGGKLIAYADSDNRLFVVPASGGTPIQVDHSPRGRIGGYSFSPDGRWLAYTKPEDNSFRSIFIYDTRDKRILRVTDGYFNDHAPSWSSDGKYLAFLSERTLNPLLDRLDAEAIIDKATKPYLVLLSNKTRAPFLPKELWGKTDDDKSGDKQGSDKAGKGDKPAKPVKVEIDPEGITARVVEVPVPAGHYDGLWAGKGVLLYMRSKTRGLADLQRLWFSDDEPSETLMRFDFESKEAKAFLKQVIAYDVSRDGKTIAVRRPEGKLLAFELAAKPPADKELADKTLPLAAIRERVDPRDEWRQMFGEVWRMMRDLYWTPDMAGVDWKAVRAKYAVLLPRVATRRELSDLLGEMIGELSLGHTYVWGGDERGPKPVPVGLLGADLEPDASGRYRFARVYSGVRWDPARHAPPGLLQAGVSAGDFLLAIDGRPLRAGDNVYSRLQKAAGQVVQLEVARDPQGKGARKIEVTTLSDEHAIRYYAWVENNRQLVASKTNDRVGYLHLPDMMTAGMVEFDRWYYPQVRKQGLIVDARWNRGGFVSEILIKRLSRRVLAWWRSRRGEVEPYPAGTLNGRLVVLTNERAGSDGDIFPRVVQVGKLGPVIGTRTWGGVVGISLQNPLVDKGVSTRPGYAFFDLQRRWGVEGEGVQPDIVVDNDPGAVFRGEDTQLRRGIATMLELLEKNPPQPPDFGASPDKRKKAWVDRYGQPRRP